MVDEEMTDEELSQKLAALIGTTPTQEEKHNVHTFLRDVVLTRDTTRVGYLKEEEIGLPRLPMRTYKELALFCDEVADMGYYADYFNKKAEILTSTSLSKDAKLLELAVVTRREVADVTKKRKKNKGWFRKKDDSEEK